MQPAGEPRQSVASTGAAHGSSTVRPRVFAPTTHQPRTPTHAHARPRTPLHVQGLFLVKSGLFCSKPPCIGPFYGYLGYYGYFLGGPSQTPDYLHQTRWRCKFIVGEAWLHVGLPPTTTHNHDSHQSPVYAAFHDKITQK